MKLCGGLLEQISVLVLSAGRSIVVLQPLKPRLQGMNTAIVGAAMISVLLKQCYHAVT